MDRSGYDDIVNRCECARLLVRESLDRKMKELAGEHFSRIVENVAGAAGFVTSSLPSLRRAAIHALAFHWHVRPTTDYAAHILELAKNDSDPEVRRDALGAVGMVFRETDDVEAGYVLARTVMDKGETIRTRKEAFIGLCSLRAAFKESWAIRSFPEGVDWSFVEGFLDRSRPPQPADPIASFAALSAFPVAEEYLELIRGHRTEGAKK